MKKGIVTGAFDLLHAGHIYLLKEAKKKCDYLIVGLHVDPSIENENKNKPIESILERQIRLDACKYVNKIIVYEKEEDLENMFFYMDADIRFLGDDYLYAKKWITDPDIVPIEILSPSIRIHTSDIRERIKNAG